MEACAIFKKYRPRPRVHKETENEDQAQDQTYKLQLLDQRLCKFDENFTILFGVSNVMAIANWSELLPFKVLKY